MKKIVFFALVSVLLLNLAIASHGKALNQNDLPQIEQQVRLLIAKAGIKESLAKDIASNMEGEVSPKRIEFGHIALDVFSNADICVTLDFEADGQNGVLSLLFRWQSMLPRLLDRSYWFVNTEVSNDIHEDTTWTQDGSPYYVTRSITIHGGVTLNIEQGTVVRFRKFSDPREQIQLWVGDGTLFSQGDDDPVTFTSSCDFEDRDKTQSWSWETSDWQGIQAHWNGNIIVNHTTFEYANWAIDTWEREGQIDVSNSMFRKCQGGVHTSGWSSVNVTNNTISDCWGTAIYVDFQDASDAGGDIAGNKITVHPDSWPGQVMEIRGGIPNISRNYITGRFNHGIYTAHLEPSAVITGNTINMPDGAYNGIYAHGGNCTISKNVVTGFFEDTGIGVEGFHGVVTSNTITSYDGAWAGIYAWWSECTISENEVTGSFETGIGVEDLHGAVTSNTITSYDGSWAGIHAWWGDCTISENEVTGSFDHGIGVEDSYNVVTSNTITSPPGSSWAGIAVWWGEPEISDNAIGSETEGYFDVGIYLESVGPAGLVSGNTITAPMDDTRKHAIYIWGGELMVSYNPISGTFDQVIRVEGESTARISEHQLTGNYGVYCVNSEPHINFNIIEGNEEFGVYNETPGDYTVDATENWWGHETGPYHPEQNPDGQGDRVSDGVDFIPWLE